MRCMGLFVLLVAVSLRGYSVQAIELQSLPETFIQGVTSNLTLRCVPGDTVNITSNIVTFQLTKGGVLLATCKPDDVILNQSLRTTKYSASKQIDPDNLSSSFLLFTIQFPESEDEGQYMCHMNYEDKDGIFQNAESNFNLKQNATDDVNLHNHMKQLQQLVENMRVRVSLLETQVFQVATVNTNQSRIIANLTALSSNHLAFFATLEKKTTIHTNDIAVFNHVAFNHGGAFNATSGTFVAPRKGFYLLSLMCQVHTEITMIGMEMLLTVDGKTIMKLFFALHGGQQSGSIVYDLPAGSEVKVVMGNIKPKTAIPVWLNSEYLSYFSSYYLG